MIEVTNNPLLMEGAPKENMPAVAVAVAVDVEAETADGNKVFGFFDEFSAFFFCMLLVSAWGDDSGTFGAAFVAQAETEVKLQKQSR